MIPHTKVFVGSLPPGSKPEELRRLFENYGVVTECDIMNRCGFVHMETQDMAENAIRALNNTIFRGSSITVEHGRMKDRAGPRQGNPGSVGGGGGMMRGGGGRPPRIGGGDRRGGGMRRDFSNMGGSGAGGPRGGDGGGSRGGDGSGPRGGFGNQNNQGMRGGRGGGGGGLGPMRRDRGFNQQRSGPYNRNAGGGGPGLGASNTFDKWQGGGVPKGGNRNFDDNDYNGSQGAMGGGGSMGVNDRFSSGNFGMGNQDRRGFALPESRQMFASDIGQTRAPPMGGGTGGGGGFRGGNPGFERRQGGNFNDGGDTFSRRAVPGVGGNMNSSGMGGGRGGFNRGGGGGGMGGGGGNYNQSFPPLGGGGGNRNGPRRDMPNRRY